MVMKSNDIILGILLEEPATGYEIKEKFSTSFSYFYNASFGSIYPILHKLTKEDKVVFKNIPQDGKPNKKIYFITEKGKRAFQEYLQKPIENEKIKWDFMAHLFYSKYLSTTSRLELINSEIEMKESELRILTTLQRKLRKQRIDPYQVFCLDLGIKQKQLVVTELQKLRDNIIIENNQTNKV